MDSIVTDVTKCFEISHHVFSSLGVMGDVMQFQMARILGVLEILTQCYNTGSSDIEMLLRLSLEVPSGHF